MVGWRANFALLALAGAAIAAAVLWRIPRPLAHADGESAAGCRPWRGVAASRATRYTLVVGGTSSGYHAAPHRGTLILITRLGVTPGRVRALPALGTWAPC